MQVAGPLSLLPIRELLFYYSAFYGANNSDSYAGVPIRSPAGYIIGIYSIVDDKPRYDFGEQDLNILKDLAATVMDHLILGTVRGRHHRADRMVKGLGLFVDGKASLRDWWLKSGHLEKGPTTKDDGRLKAQADKEFGPRTEVMLDSDNQQNEIPLRMSLEKSLESAESQLSQKITPGIKSGLEEIAVSLVSGQKAAAQLLPIPSPISSNVTGDYLDPDDTETPSMSQNMAALFARASNLIRESINVEGCLFLDGSGDLVADKPGSPSAEDEPLASREGMSSEQTLSEEEIIGMRSSRGARANFPNTFCEVLGCSSKFETQIIGNDTTTKFRFPRDFLHRLFRRYPNGAILNFEHDGTL